MFRKTKEKRITITALIEQNMKEIMQELKVLWEEN